VGHIGTPGPLGSGGREGSYGGPGRLRGLGRFDEFVPRRENDFFCPLHFSYNIEVELIPGKIFRIIRKLWEFS
jgi:hypothetical protein